MFRSRTGIKKHTNTTVDMLRMQQVAQPFDITAVNRNEILEIMRTEQEVRYSDVMQNVYTKQQVRENGAPEDIAPINVDVEIQKYVLRKFGYSDDAASLQEYWKIPSTYWTDDEIKQSIFYMKHNIFSYPPCSVGGAVVDASLLTYPDLSPKSVAELSLRGGKRPVVIFAGSMT